MTTAMHMVLSERRLAIPLAVLSAMVVLSCCLAVIFSEDRSFAGMFNSVLVSEGSPAATLVASVTNIVR